MHTGEFKCFWSVASISENNSFSEHRIFENKLSEKEKMKSDQYFERLVEKSLLMKYL